MHDLEHEIRYACRSLLTFRGYLLKVLLSMAVGIGASTSQ